MKFTILNNLNRWGLTALLSVFSLSGVAVAELGPDPSTVRINGISYAGSGCPAGSVSQNLSEDAKAFTLLFDSYVAETGPGMPLSLARKNCQVAVDLRFPQGWSYSLFTVDYRGYARLESGTSGQQVSSYYFQGQSKTGNLRTTYYGPAERDYQIRDTLGLDALVWSPCGANRALNMNTQVRVTAPSQRRALMTIDSIDGELKHIYGMKWRRCQ
ncbi:MAG: DUF4360 domain-containing protein [Bdellovibrionales bacterium]|nr:DUF4360 domain-containing protein [Bdellovibrionales bacterium]